MDNLLKRTLLGIAFAHNVDVTISYVSAKLEATTRKIKIQAFLDDNGNIEALDYGKNELRHFKIERIQNITF